MYTHLATIPMPAKSNLNYTPGLKSTWQHLSSGQLTLVLLKPVRECIMYIKEPINKELA